MDQTSKTVECAKRDCEKAGLALPKVGVEHRGRKMITSHPMGHGKHAGKLCDETPTHPGRRMGVIARNEGNWDL